MSCMWRPAKGPCWAFCTGSVMMCGCIDGNALDRMLDVRICKAGKPCQVQQPALLKRERKQGAWLVDQLRLQ